MSSHSSWVWNLFACRSYKFSRTCSSKSTTRANIVSSQAWLKILTLSLYSSTRSKSLEFIVCTWVLLMLKNENMWNIICMPVSIRCCTCVEPLPSNWSFSWTRPEYIFISSLGNLEPWVSNYIWCCSFEDVSWMIEIFHTSSHINFCKPIASQWYRRGLTVSHYWIAGSHWSKCTWAHNLWHGVCLCSHQTMVCARNAVHWCGMDTQGLSFPNTAVAMGKAIALHQQHSRMFRERNTKQRPDFGRLKAHAKDLTCTIIALWENARRQTCLAMCGCFQHLLGCPLVVDHRSHLNS